MTSKYDFFISHASEDKARIAEPLSICLQRAGFSVWIDSEQILPGDSLVQKIQRGLLLSRFALLVATPHFFNRNKYWTHQEHDALAALESGGSTRIIPILHGFTIQQLMEQAPLLAGRLSLTTNQGLDTAIAQLFSIFPDRPPSVEIAGQHRKMYPFWEGIAYTESNQTRHIIKAEFLRYGNDIYASFHAGSAVARRVFEDNYQVRGQVINEEFLSIAAVHTDQTALNLGYILFRLARTGDQMTGKYVGVSRISEDIVTGNIRLESMAKKGR